MALVNGDKNYIRISKIELDFKSSILHVTLDMYISENVRNKEKEYDDAKSKLIARFTTLSHKGPSVYKSQDEIVDEVRANKDVQDEVVKLTNLDEINKYVDTKVKEALASSHICGRTQDEDLEFVSIGTQLQSLECNSVITNTVTVAIPFSHVNIPAVGDEIRGYLYEFLSKDSRYSYIWNR